MEDDEEPDYYFKNYAPRPFSAITDQISESVPSNATFKTSVVSFKPDSDTTLDNSSRAKSPLKKIKFYLRDETTTSRIIEAPIESDLKRPASTAEMITSPPQPVPLPDLSNISLNKKPKKVKEIILKNVSYVCNSNEETAYLLAIRISNKMIAEGIYNHFGPIHYVDIPEKTSYENTCTACLALWNTNLHDEFIQLLNHQVKFYGRTVTMKSGRNLPRTSYSWLNPEGPVSDPKKNGSPKIKPKQAFEKPESADLVYTPPVIATPPSITSPAEGTSSIDEKLCCGCCYESCCCCSYLLLNIQLSFNLCCNTIRNVVSKKIKPTCDIQENSSMNYIK